MPNPCIIIGTMVVRRTAFAFDKFLQNQKEIQEKYPQSKLIIATDEPDYKDELNRLLNQYGIEGDVVLYTTEKPEYARSRIWSITCGRNALREYMLNHTCAEYLLFIDADMTCDPSVVSIMKQQIERGYDVVHSGYKLRHYGICLIGLGCSIVTRGILEKIPFRCIEYENQEVLDEGTLFELDLVHLHRRIGKGFYLRIDHYTDAEKAISIETGELSRFQRITTHPYSRFMLTKFCILVRRDIGSKLQKSFF